MGEQFISSFVGEVFAANTANNFLLETARASHAKVYSVPVLLEPAFESFDAVKTYRTVKDLKLVTEDKGGCGAWFVVGLKIPLGDEIEWQRLDALLSGLSGFGGVVSFEIFCSNGEAVFLVGSGSSELLSVLCGAWQSFFPSLVFVDAKDCFAEFKSFGGKLSLFDLYCEPPYYRRVNCDRVVGGVASVLKVFSGLRAGECGFFQTIFVPVKNDWGLNVKTLLKAESVLGARSPFGVSSSSAVKDVSKPMFATSVRFGCVSKNDSSVIGGLKGFVGCFVHDGKPLRFRTEKDFFRVVGKEKTFGMLANRSSFCSGMLLCSDELSGFVHLPDKGVLGLGLRIDVARGFKPSVRLLSGRPLGINKATGKDVVVCLPDSEKNKCMYQIGSPRMGKSTSQINQILEIIMRRDCGVGLVDPHRTSAKELLKQIPKSELHRVVHVDFDDPTHCIDFNPFDEADEESYGRLCGDAVNSLKNLFESESFNRMSHILRMCVYALFVLKKNLSSIPLLLSKASPEGARLRAEVVLRANNEEVKRFWQTEFKSYRDEAFSPILNRLSVLFADTNVLRIFSREKNKLNIKQIMDEGKILIVALPSNIDSSKLIGGFLIGLFQKCALARTACHDCVIVPFFLFVDEFHRFSSGRIIESIINETVKAGLHLCVANQETGQLSDELLMAVLSMPNIMVFNINFLDAKRLVPVFCGRVSVDDILGLGLGEVFAKIGGEVVDFTCFGPRQDGSEEVRAQIILESRQKYYTPICEIVQKKPKAVMARKPDTF